jgi:hypothetical protein
VAAPRLELQALMQVQKIPNLAWVLGSLIAMVSGLAGRWFWLG